MAEIPDGRYRPQHDASDVLLNEQCSVQLLREVSQDATWHVGHTPGQYHRHSAGTIRDARRSDILRYCSRRTKVVQGFPDANPRQHTHDERAQDIEGKPESPGTQGAGGEAGGAILNINGLQLLLDRLAPSLEQA